MSVALNYRLISENLPRQLAISASRPQVALETEYYLENYRSVTSIEAFLDDPRLFRTAMTAFGLEEFAFARGYMRKVLEEGVSDPGALALRTTDVRILEFARAFDFEQFGAETMQRAATGQAVVDAYVRQSLEVRAEQETSEGLRLALYFERKAGDISTPYDILADAALAKVVRVLLGLPEAFAGADIDRQAEVIEKRLDFAKLADPEEVQRLLIRFAALWDATEEPTQDPVLTLFSARGTNPTVSLSLALSLSQLRLGGP